MEQHQEELRIATRGHEPIEITGLVREVVRRSGVALGLVTVFIQHTSASLVIQENADPAVLEDLIAWFGRVAPEGSRHYTHTAEGPDDMPSHLRSAITRTSETIPIQDGELMLGTWQGLHLLEHRELNHTRVVVVHVIGEPEA